MTTWVLETNVFSEVCFDRMVAHFKATETPYHTVRIIPFAHTVEGKTPVIEGPVVCYGSLGIQKLAKAQGWTPGVWFEEENFSSTAYKALGDLFLNNDAAIMPMSEVEAYMADNNLHEVFIKPNGDMKQFAGQLISGEDFSKWYAGMVDIGYLNVEDEGDFEVVLAAPKELGREFRIVVVSGMIAGYSRVRPTASQVPIPAHALATVIEAVQLYRPAEVFVVDVAELFTSEILHGEEIGKTEWKIIEYNNFNSAGLYECGVENIIDTINDHIARRLIHT